MSGFSIAFKESVCVSRKAKETYIHARACFLPSKCCRMQNFVGQRQPKTENGANNEQLSHHPSQQLSISWIDWQIKPRMMKRASTVGTILVICILSLSHGFSTSRCSSSSRTSQLKMSTEVAENVQAVEMPDKYAQCGKCKSSYTMKDEDLGGGRGRRLECSVCGHSWFQSRDRLMSLSNGFEMIPLPETDAARIKTNIAEDRYPGFVGEKKLYVGNISFQATEADILEFFSECGVVGEVALVRDDEGRMRGFGFVTMRTNAEGEKAIETLDGKDLCGRNVAVRESNG